MKNFAIFKNLKSKTTKKGSSINSSNSDQTINNSNENDFTQVNLETIDEISRNNHNSKNKSKISDSHSILHSMCDSENDPATSDNVFSVDKSKQREK